jgi:hypothetical protein
MILFDDLNSFLSNKLFLNTFWGPKNRTEYFQTTEYLRKSDIVSYNVKLWAQKLTHSVSLWAQKLTHYVSFWMQKTWANFFSNWFFLFLLNTYTIACSNCFFFFYYPEKNIGTRNWRNVSVSGPRNWAIMSVSGSRNDAVPFSRFLGLETDIMGERYFMENLWIFWIQICIWSCESKSKFKIIVLFQVKIWQLNIKFHEDFKQPPFPQFPFHRKLSNIEYCLPFILSDNHRNNITPEKSLMKV